MLSFFRCLALTALVVAPLPALAAGGGYGILLFDTTSSMNTVRSASGGYGILLVDTISSSPGHDSFIFGSLDEELLVAFDGDIERIHIETDDALVALDLAVEVLDREGSDLGDFSLSFDQTTTSVAFDGRLLTADDLKDEPVYHRSSAKLPGASGYCFDLFRGGVRVASFEVGEDGIAPFLLDRVPDAFAVRDNDATQLQLDTWSFSGAIATLADGTTLAVDTISVRGHVGHALGFQHDHGRLSVGVIGVAELRVQVESDSELEWIETLDAE